MTAHGDGDGAEDADVRLKRLRLRSWRRGTREMDLMLGPFADAALARLPPALLDDFEALLEENDPDLYQWLSRGALAPPQFGEILRLIRAHHGLS